MLAKKYRLTTEKDFKKLYKQGQGIYSPCFTIKHLSNNLYCCRLGVVVSKKVMPKAVDRNKTKRRIRNIFLKLESQIKKPTDIALIVKKNIFKINYKNLEQDIKNLFQKKGLI